MFRPTFFFPILTKNAPLVASHPSLSVLCVNQLSARASANGWAIFQSELETSACFNWLFPCRVGPVSVLWAAEGCRLWRDASAGSGSGFMGGWGGLVHPFTHLCSVQSAVSRPQGLRSITAVHFVTLLLVFLESRVLLLLLLLSAQDLLRIPSSAFVSVYLFHFSLLFFPCLCLVFTHQSLNKHSLSPLHHRIPQRRSRRRSLPSPALSQMLPRP